MNIKSRLYIHRQRIRPGDILLTKSSGIISNLICLFDGGEYSHAAIVTSARSLLESDDHGVGITGLWPDRVEEKPTFRDLCSFDEAVTDAVVLRHTDLYNQAAQERFSRMLPPIEAELRGLQYPTWSTLADTLNPASLKGVVARLITEVLGLVEHKPIVPGPFCSELVALAYAKLDYPLVSDNLPMERVTPGALQKSSFMTSVPNAVTSADPDAKLWKDVDTYMGTLRRLSQRQTSVAREVNLRAREEVIRRQIQEIEAEPVKVEAASDLLMRLKRIADDDVE